MRWSVLAPTNDKSIMKSEHTHYAWMSFMLALRKMIAHTCVPSR